MHYQSYNANLINIWFLTRFAIKIRLVLVQAGAIWLDMVPYGLTNWEDMVWQTGVIWVHKLVRFVFKKLVRYCLTLLTLNSWAHLHPHRWIPGKGGGWKKPEYFVMLDLYEDTNRILAYEQIMTWEGVVLYWWITPRSCQGHIKVISRSKSQKILKIPTFYQFQAV